MSRTRILPNKTKTSISVSFALKGGWGDEREGGLMCSKNEGLGEKGEGNSCV